MYVVNKKFGIGQVIEMTENEVVVYFEEEEVEKTLLKVFTTIYETEEEAEKALNPEVDYDAVANEIKAEKLQHSENMKAIRRGEELIAESTKELMKHI